MGCKRALDVLATSPANFFCQCSPYAVHSLLCIWLGDRCAVAAVSLLSMACLMVHSFTRG